jgi:hypothetical protein
VALAGCGCHTTDATGFGRNMDFSGLVFDMLFGTVALAMGLKYLNELRVKFHKRHTREQELLRSVDDLC